MRPFDLLGIGGDDFTDLDVPPREPIDAPPLETLKRWADNELGVWPRSFSVIYDGKKWFVRTIEGPMIRRASGSDLTACAKKATE